MQGRPPRLRNGRDSDDMHERVNDGGSKRLGVWYAATVPAIKLTVMICIKMPAITVRQSHINDDTYIMPTGCFSTYSRPPRLSHNSENDDDDDDANSIGTTKTGEDTRTGRDAQTKTVTHTVGGIYVSPPVE